MAFIGVCGAVLIGIAYGSVWRTRLSSLGVESQFLQL